MNFNRIGRSSSEISIGSSRSLTSTSSLPKVDSKTTTSKPGMFRSHSVGSIDLTGQQQSLSESVDKTAPQTLHRAHSQVMQHVGGLVDDAPLPQTEPSGIHDLSSIIKSRFTGIEKGLRGIFKSKSHFFKGLQSNKSLKQEAFDKARGMMETEVAKVNNGEHSDLIFSLTTKTKDEVRSDVVKSVLGMRDSKYGPLIQQAEIDFQPRIEAYEKHQALYSEAKEISSELGRHGYVPKGERDEAWNQKFTQLKERFIEIHSEIGRDGGRKPFPTEMAVSPDMSSLQKMEKPELDLYALLSDNKKALVDNIIAGFESVEMPNRVESLGFDEKGLQVPTKVTIGGRSFSVGEEFAAGGGGILLKATDESTGKEYALKITNETQGHLAWDSMRQEAVGHYKASLTGSDHILGLEGVVQYQQDGEAFLLMIMDLAPGGDMEKLTSRTLPELDLDDDTNDLILLQNMQDVAKGLVDTHKQGMVHLDLKPGNIFLMDDGRAMLADFGEVRDSGFTEQEVGTPEYMAPEVHDPERTGDLKADVFSFGMMMHDMFVGDNPFMKDGGFGVAQKILDFGSDPNNRLIDKEHLSPIEELINQATHPDPEQRPTMQEILSHPAFQNPKLGTESLRALTAAVVMGQHDDLKQLEELL